MTQRVLRYLTGTIGPASVLIGLSLLLAPGRQSLLFAVLPSGPAGPAQSARIAGLFLGMGAFCVAGAVMASDGVLMVPAAFLSLIAFGRLVNLIADGSSPDAARSLVIEVIAIGLLTLAIVSLRREQRAPTRALLIVPLVVLVGLGGAYVSSVRSASRSSDDSSRRGWPTGSSPRFPMGCTQGSAGPARRCPTPPAQVRACWSSPAATRSWWTLAKEGRARRR